MRTIYTLLLASSSLLVVQTQASAGPLSVCNANPRNLVANCGFETGDFTSWALSGNDTPLQLGNLYGVEGTDPVNGISPDSGSSQAYFADLDSSATTLSQTLATQIGVTYQISWFLAQDTALVSPYSNSFSLSFGGAKVANLTAIPVEGYTKYSYGWAATSASTNLSFTIGNDLGAFLLDDVTVQVAPEPASWLELLIGSAFCGFVARRRARSVSHTILR
jgi:hypothetical protein